MVHNSSKILPQRTGSLTTRRQTSEQDWLDKVIVRNASGDLELTSKGWWQRMLPRNNAEQCRRVVDSYLSAEGPRLNATSLAHLSANVMNLNAVLRAPPAGPSLTPLAHPVTRAGGRIKVQVDALAREVALLSMDRDTHPTRAFSIDLRGAEKSLVPTFIVRHDALNKKKHLRYC